MYTVQIACDNTIPYWFKNVISFRNDHSANSELSVFITQKLDIFTVWNPIMTSWSMHFKSEQEYLIFVLKWG